MFYAMIMDSVHCCLVGFNSAPFSYKTKTEFHPCYNLKFGAHTKYFDISREKPKRLEIKYLEVFLECHLMYNNKSISYDYVKLI